MTVRRRRERERKAQNERLDRFAELVSHDLRNPLNVAAGRTELAIDREDFQHLEETVVEPEWTPFEVTGVKTQRLADDQE